MKKFLAIALCVCLMATCLVACGEKEADYKLGMGVTVNMGDSATGNAQVDATVATVVTDKDGKIVACRLDVAQNKMDVTDGAIDPNLTFLSKREKGDDYGMRAAVNYGMDWNGDGETKEWYEQAEAFEKYVVGKTGAEVAAMGTQTAGEGYVITAEDGLLSAGCTIQVADFMEAVAAACNDEQGMSFKSKGKFTLGVAANSFATDSNADEGLVAMYTDFAAAVVEDGKIVAAINDAVQPKITIDADGAIVDTAYKATKRNLKDDYGMAPAVNYGMDWNGDGEVKEWYLQSEAFSKYVVGKTADEVAGLATQTVEGSGYVISNVEDLLNAGCTIQITSLQNTTAKAANNAR